MLRKASSPHGISSGANILAALTILLQDGPEAVVTTVLPDSNKKYLSTDLFRSEPLRPEYMTPRVSFLGWKAIPACACPH